MNGTTYVVTLSLQTQGNFGTQVGGLGEKAHQAHSRITSLGEGFRKAGELAERMSSRVGGVLESIAEKAEHAAMTAAKIGGATVMGLATYGVAKLNNELEQTQLSLGAIAQAQGFAHDFAEGFGLAGRQLAAMKQDVKTLPGDLGQLSDIMKMIATPAAQGGANLDQIRALAGRTMLTSTILGVPQEVASREMAGLLSGRAGAHNIFGARLGLIGDEAEKFNKMAPDQRLARINQELDKYSGAADKFGQSFVANFTTLKDNLKYSLLAEATSPLFQSVKADLVSINSWFDHNQDRVQQFARVVGNDLVKAWDAVVARVAKIEPIIGKAVNALANADGKKLEGFLARGALGVVGTKVAGKAIETGGSMLSGGFGIAGSAMKLAGSAEGMAALGSALGVLSNPVTLGAAAAGLALLATGAVALGGAIHALTDDTSQFHQRAVELWQAILSSGEEALGRLKEAGDSLYSSLAPLADAMGTDLLFALKELAPLAVTAAGGLVAAAHGLEMILSVARSIPGVGAFVPGGGAADGWSAGRGQTSFGDTPGPAGKLREAAEAFGSAVAKKGGGGGGGGTHIGRVEIKVEGAGEPARIARLVVNHLERLSRNPTSSKYVPSYVRTDPGSSTP